MAVTLTREQEQAVTNRGGKLLVSAAAGSGKTKVLVDRLMGYLTDPSDPADLNDFLIITYTKAAASELRGKIAAKLTERIAEDPSPRLQQQMQRLFLTKISTVHGFCADLLREYAYKLDLPADFRVADENECREIRDTVLSDLLDRAYESAAEDADFRAFVDTQGLGRSDSLVPELILKVYDSARCDLDPDGWLDSCLADISETTDAGQTLWGSYLMEQLKDYLCCQIRVMEQCAAEAEACAGFEKAAVNLRDTLYQLQRLWNSVSWDDVVNRKGIDYGRLSFPKKNPDPELAERIKAARNACKKGVEKWLHSFADPSDQTLGDLKQSIAGTRGIIALVRQFDREYNRAKKSRRVLDFGDLEHKTLDLLMGSRRTGPTAAAAEISARFREIMVDEYQDSNAVQDAIFSALTEKRQNCFMVGDVKQSIYQFRLADPGIFLKKYDSYLPADQADAGEGRKVLLSQNFRSGPEVIEAVNDVFSTCMRPKVGGLHYGEAEALREGIPRGKLPEPGVELYALEIREDTYGEEAAFTAQKIHEMLKNGTLVRVNGELKPVQAEDIVILLRSPGSVGVQFQRELEKLGIRCSSGGGNDLLATAEIGTLRSLLQTIYNPRLDIPLISVLASPVFGFTADDLAAFRGRQKKGSVFDALCRDDSDKAKEFLAVLDTLRREARMKTLTELLERCFTLTRIDSIYAAMPGGDVRSGNLRGFFQLAADYEQGNHRDLGQFLEYLDNMEGKGLISSGAAAGGAVTIMSIHKSKGLEFPVVFLCGLSREFNRESLRAQILCDKKLGLGLSVADTKNRIRYPALSKRAIAAKMTVESVSEEMRVLYVAMTRAKDRLIMTYSARNLEAELKDIALRLDFDGGELLCRDVVCPGEWVMLTAMQRAEAGALFSLAGKPAHVKVSDYPWRIEVSAAPEAKVSGVVSSEHRARMPEGTEEILQKALAFRYAHREATQTPSKQTATGLKGRVKDEEAAENTHRTEPAGHSLRRPSFLEKKPQGKAYGSAIHDALHYIRYEKCGSAQEVQSEISRMVAEGFLTQQQGELVNCEKIASFFATDEGKKLRGGAEYIREFKFSILDDASRYGENLDEEQVLLQGVVDCAIVEQEGITVIDFKTDYVTEETLDTVVGRYRLQVLAYAQALSRIYEMPVKARKLYFFHMDRFVDV